MEEERGGEGDGRVDLTHDAIVFGLVPVEAQLHLPRKTAQAVDFLLGHKGYNVAVVHVARHERDEGGALELAQLAQLARHLVGRRVEVFDLLQIECGERGDSLLRGTTLIGEPLLQLVSSK